MATDIRRRFRRPKESSPELVWEDPESSVSCSSSQLRNHDAQKERRGESPMRRGYVPLSTRVPCAVRPSISGNRPCVVRLSISGVRPFSLPHGDNADATHRRAVSVR